MEKYNKGRLANKEGDGRVIERSGGDLRITHLRTRNNTRCPFSTLYEEGPE